MAMHNRDIAATGGNTARIQPHGKYYSDHQNSNLQGFIYHPSGFPIEWRYLRSWQKTSSIEYHGEGHMGLCFEADQYIRPGSQLEITIPLRGEMQKFTGRVILVRNMGDRCEVGIWFNNKADVGRIRIVEQICHIEVYLKHKRHHEGPFVSPERVAQEWITRFASSFPSFG